MHVPTPEANTGREREWGVNKTPLGGKVQLLKEKRKKKRKLRKERKRKAREPALPNSRAWCEKEERRSQPKLRQGWVYREGGVIQRGGTPKEKGKGKNHLGPENTPSAKDRMLLVSHPLQSSYW